MMPYTHTRNSPYAFVLAVLILCVFVGLYPLPYRGSLDFIQYWTAFRLAYEGQDPYQPLVLLKAQQLLRPEATEPIMMWNAPWILILLSPILLLPFTASAWVWLVVSLLLLLWCVSASYDLFPKKSQSNVTTWIFACFLPVLACFAFGQISILLLAGSLLLIRGVLRNSRSDIALGIILASLKPHLFLFTGVVLLSVVLRRADIRRYVVAVLPMMVLLLATELIFPGLLQLWNEGLSNPGEGAVAPPAFAVTTLVGVVRDILADSSGHIPMWPMVVVPFVPLILFLIWRVRTTSSFNLAQYWPGIFGVSYLFSPYGWVFDAVLLLPCFLHAIVLLAHARMIWVDRLVLFLLISSQIFSLAMLWIPNLELHQGSFWWLPLFVFCSWWYANLRTQKIETAYT